MDNEKIVLPIRSALIPVFYKNFHCLAQNCKDNCCVHDWRIAFNKKDYLRLRRLDAPPALRERLKQSVRQVQNKEPDGIYGYFDLKSNSGRCSFLDSDGLCAIQRACGHDALPFVCTNFPRRISCTPAAKEYALSPSCEGVLQQLWDLPDGIEFIEDPLPKEEWKTGSIVQGNNLILFFAPVRSLFIDILQNRDLSLTERMLYLGITIQRLQKEDWTRFDPDSWIDLTVSLTDVNMIKMTANVGNRNMYISQNLNVLNKMGTGMKWVAEICDALEAKTAMVFKADDGTGMETCPQVTTSFSIEAYEDALAQFQTAFSGYEYFFENLMVASALYLNFPNLASREALWKSYVSLCNLYSLYRFTSVLGCKQSVTKERLFHMIVMVSRATLHSKGLFQGFQEELFQHDSSTLAHMAILLNG